MKLAELISRTFRNGESLYVSLTQKCSTEAPGCEAPGALAITGSRRWPPIDAGPLLRAGARAEPHPGRRKRWGSGRNAGAAALRCLLAKPLSGR
jgi:hypothetical protein